jgi:hypothetical protein
MGINHRNNRLIANVLMDQVQGVAGGFNRCEWIDNDVAAVRLNECRVREGLTAHLGNPVGDFEQATEIIEQSMAPQAGMYRVRRIAVEERFEATPDCHRHPV